jgi:raffinose/stachyose/melibiose transport system permease protein
LPGLSAFLLFTFAPLIHAAYLSLYKWDGLLPGTYVGLHNYQTAVQDPEVQHAFLHAAELVVGYSILPVALGLLVTGLLTRHVLRGVAFFRTVYFLPQMIAGVVIAQAFVWFYAGDGPLSALLDALHLGFLVPSAGWLGDFTTALPAIGLVGTWVTFGLCMVLFIAGVQKIPSSLYDAARVDGAGAIREFFAVTLPGLRNEVTVALVLTMINSFRSFDIVYNATRGGPGDSTTVPSLVMYENAFVSNNVGYSCAIAVLLAALIFALALIINRVAEPSDR